MSIQGYRSEMLLTIVLGQPYIELIWSDLLISIGFDFVQACTKLHCKYHVLHKLCFFKKNALSLYLNVV